MSKTILTRVGVRKVISLVLVLVLVFGWSAIAYAQTSADAQYGNPAPKVTVSGGGGGTETGAGIGEVLPATGGPLLPLVAIGTFALGTTGLLVLRRADRR